LWRYSHNTIPTDVAVCINITENVGFCVRIYYMTLLVAALYSVKWDNRWMKNWKGLEECGHGLIEALCMQLLGEIEENSEISKSEQPSVPSEVRIEHFSNTKMVSIQEWTVCCLRGCRGVIRKTTGATKSVLYGSLKKKSVGREPPFRDDLSAEVEESQLLEAVTRERPLNTAGLKRLNGYCGDLWIVISYGAVINCNYELCAEMINKSNIQSKTPKRVTSWEY
jgi:hypothetical protein